MIIASPMNSAAPMIPAKNRIGTLAPVFFISNARSEKVPPSPLLSALSRNRTYLKWLSRYMVHRPTFSNRNHSLAKREMWASRS